VETAANRVPGVEGAVVLVPPASDDRATIVVTGALSAAEVLHGMRQYIDALKIPTRCVVLPELPLTANGKVARNRVAELVREHATA
jgi:acyl-coenzyme A synthetase/AMP-(fatty) acid ligase